ncbi:FKBP-type peptidyl-prolyl cis-trans isomerase [Spirosoma montaniterrae]|uniref:Peptidyl-prolyl cis-trans isomerase n=1 Tax=Spirosoma montaniterrae TaxID=1178516 RepID=A0A1P9X223_9BACT|nr:FKBP-type peptidyl-prolyl cis-trans isomerase [Spirosoma montaniterrae]AQG81643.1 hypothetical protein AWR27_21445 [Spirosoma montaniterrae]
MYKLVLGLLVVWLAGALSSCNKIAGVDPSTTPSGIFIRDTSILNRYAASKGLVLTTTASNLRYVISSRNPTGKQAALGEELEFNYVLTTLTRKGGTGADSLDVIERQVDTTFRVQPNFFPFTDGLLISGLQEAMLLMREGERAIFLMPSIIGFGSRAQLNGAIPPNTPIRWDVTLRRSRSEDQRIREYITANKLVVTDSTTLSGLRIIKTRANPTGDSLSANRTAIFNYTGRQLRARSAFGFDSTATGLRRFNVPGFNAGLAKLRAGERALLIFPSSLGFQNAGIVVNGTFLVPPGTPLLYDVEVTSIR